MWTKELDRREAAAYNAALPGKLAAEKRDRIIRLYGTPQNPKYPHTSEICGTCGKWPMWDTPKAPTTHRRCLPCWDAMFDW